MKTKVGRMSQLVVWLGVLGLMLVSGGDSKSKEQERERQAAQAARQGKEITLELPGGVKLKMVRIPAKGKKFWMGSPKTEKNRSPDEEQHEVAFSRDFYLGVTAVTQAQYRAVMKSNPSYFCKDGDGKLQVVDQNTDDFPVENVSWAEAKEFCQKVGKIIGDGQEYRLPTESEREYACRGGQPTQDNFPFYLKNGRISSLLGGQINFRGDFPYGYEPYGTAKKGQYLGRTAQCGSFPDSENELGLRDMHGNIWEWCSDWYGPYPKKPVADPKKKPATDPPLMDPTGPLEGSDRVIRGGSWCNIGQDCRAAARYGSAPSLRLNFIGFRLAQGSVGP